MPKYKYCQTCKDPDVSFENKFCSIECADLYDGGFEDSRALKQWEINIALK